MPAPRPSICARVSDRATVVEVRDRLYVRLDAEGRWTAFGEGGALFRRTVDGLVLRPVGSAFERLTHAQTDTVHGWVTRRVGELLEALAQAGNDDLELLGDRETLTRRLGRAACWDRNALAGVREQYAHAYPETVPILPPHRYRDLVVMPATGCPNHSCSFCAFYKERPFHVLDAAAFEAHLEAVRDLFGDALAERDGVFLGSASALSIPPEALALRLRSVTRLLGRPRRGIASFYDPDRGRPLQAEDWAALRDEGLTEATLGLETGLPSLRAEVGKSPDLERFGRAVAALASAGLDLSLTVLVGLGGEGRAERHLEDSVGFLEGLALRETDRVYLSPLAGSLPEERLTAELDAWRRALAPRTPARIGDYRIERFAWFA